MSVPLPWCARRNCKRRTSDPSGRCYSHKNEKAGVAAALRALTIPPPPFTNEVPGWVSGRGTPHPIGGYDEIDESYAVTWFRRNGVPHRTDGPAVISYDGHEAWYIDGKQHREDGPASIGTRSEDRFYLGGVEFEPEAYREAAELLASGTPLEWVLAYAEGRKP